ncbi:MAG: FecCD family ABC transporter permease [Victivallaceae bacterium]|nr:iron ABC transporter permease [Victivallaceae bacterium]
MKKIAILSALFVLLAVSVVISLRMGAVDIGFGEVFRALRNPDGAFLIREVRLPRVVLGLLTGAALALSGAVLQSLMRNDLASPEILGVSSGGALAYVWVILIFPALSNWSLLVAFSGSLAAALLVWMLAWKRGLEPLRLVLSGVAVSAFASALATGVVYSHADRIAGVLNFLSGSLATASWPRVELVLPWIAAGAVFICFRARALDVIALGDETASALGLRVELARFTLLAASALLAASGVVAAGLLGFVGLVAPHLARLMIGSAHRWLLPAAAATGGTLVVLGDAAGRALFAPHELPAGIVMALIGAPFFLYLLRRGGRAA